MASELLAACDPDDAAEEGNRGNALGKASPKDSAIDGSAERALIPVKVSSNLPFLCFFFCARRAFGNPNFEDLDLNQK